MVREDVCWDRDPASVSGLRWNEEGLPHSAALCPALGALSSLELVLSPESRKLVRSLLSHLCLTLECVLSNLETIPHSRRVAQNSVKT